MNGKRAKAIRRAAERITIGMPDISYEDVPVPRIKIGGHALQRRLKSCTRSLYKNTKRLYYYTRTLPPRAPARKMFKLK